MVYTVARPLPTMARIYSLMTTPSDDAIQNTYYSGYIKGHCLKLSIWVPSNPECFRIFDVTVVTPKTADVDAMRAGPVTADIICK